MDESSIFKDVNEQRPNVPLDAMLIRMAELDASDLYIKPGSPPTYRVNGVNTQFDSKSLTPDETEALILPVMCERDKRIFTERQGANLARSVAGVGRFRMNVYRQRGSVALVARRIKTDVPSLDRLALPAILTDIVMQRNGLVFVTGATGCGKSTTLAAMINHRNQSAPGHIVTIEDPIEYLHPDRKCIVSQRELGVDCQTMEDAMHDALRQAPDVILVGEIRDSQVMEDALAFAETGHLVLGTLHSTNASQTMERILGFFPPDHHAQVLMQLALSLRAIVSQRLVRRADGSGRAAAVEILLATQRIREQIKRGEIDALRATMRASEEDGMQTFDMALFDLQQAGTISTETALAAADSPADLRMSLRGFNAMSVT
ncbi:MAG TPA: PilT/PilU family type 4a pilus ATPase [Armatimonadota bacterium]|jgi:twitching motility protein PilU